MTHSYPHDNPDSPRYTGRGIVIKDNQILLMERWRDDLHYFSIPGGGIEPGETAKQTAKREILEETSVHVTVDRMLYEMHDPAGHVHTIFMCTYLSGEPQLQPNSEEAKSMRIRQKSDTYIPRWIPIKEINKLPFLYWAPVGHQLAHDIENGWPTKPLRLQS